jgi:phage regulator Rha-like protein
MVERRLKMPKIAIEEVIATRIIEIRGKKVMLDKDLASLYRVKVKVLNQSIKRNIKRFPKDFMFQLSWDEAQFSRSQNVTLTLRSQNATLNHGKNIKYLPYVFTEQGVAMLSSVLNSERAIQVNILIMRAFIRLKEVLLTHKELATKIETLENKYSEHDQTIKSIFEAIKQLLEMPPTEERKIIGFSRPKTNSRKF